MASAEVHAAGIETVRESASALPVPAELPPLLYSDRSIAVTVKPAGVISTDEPGGMPELLRTVLGDAHANVRSVHRLDRVVSGLMVYARSAAAASALSEQIRAGSFDKDYLAVIHWRPRTDEGTMRDLLQRSAAERKTYVVQAGGKDVRQAELHYRVLASAQGLTLVRIHLVTGRTHQIRAQFSSRGLPLWGDRKYSSWPDSGPIALWSAELSFIHPLTGEAMHFALRPPRSFPWTLFAEEVYANDGFRN